MRRSKVESHLAIVVTDEEVSISLVELADRAGCPVDLVEWLVNHGVIDPVEGMRRELRFRETSVQRVCRALRLKHDFGLNVSSLGLVMELLDRIDELEAELRRRR